MPSSQGRAVSDSASRLLGDEPDGLRLVGPGSPLNWLFGCASLAKSLAFGPQLTKEIASFPRILHEDARMFDEVATGGQHRRDPGRVLQAGTDGFVRGQALEVGRALF